MDDKAAAAKLAADYPGWVIENSCAGTSYWFAHKGSGDAAVHLGSGSAAGLRRLLAGQPDNPARTTGDLMSAIGEAGF